MFRRGIRKLDRLYIGARRQAVTEADVDSVDPHVTRVLNAADDVRTTFDVGGGGRSRRYMRLDLADFDNLADMPEELGKALRFIDDALREEQDEKRPEKNRQRGVLVHCRMGSNRSAAVVLAYLVFVCDMDDMATAITTVRAIGHKTGLHASPAPWFVKQIAQMKKDGFFL